MNSTRTGLLLLILLFVTSAGGCRKDGSITKKAHDAYKSPYIPISPKKAVTKPPPLPPHAEPIKPVSRFHPASKGHEYPLMRFDEIASRQGDLELLRAMTDPKQGVKTLKKVRRMGAAGRKLVRGALRSNNEAVRKQACLILANLKDRSTATVNALKDAVLMDPEPEVRATAAKSFVAIRASSAAPVLVRSLLEDPWAPARANAAQALGATGGKGAIKALIKALGDTDTWVRLRSVSALKKRRAKSAVPALVELLADPNRMVRARTKVALKQLAGVYKGDSPSDWK